MNTNDNIDQGIEVEAPPPVMYDGEDDADDIEQLPNDNDDNVVLMNNLPNPRHASKKYIAGGFMVGILAFAAFFGIGMGSGYGIENAVNKSNAASSSVSSASNMAFTTSTNGAKAGKVAKSIKTSTAKSSKSKSGKSCPTEIVTSLSDLQVDIPDGGGVSLTLALVTLPVVLNAGCGCTITNVAIDIGIDHPNVSDLGMLLVSPDNTQVLLVDQPGFAASLVSENKITFDDSDPGAKDPQTLGDDVDGSGNILAGTYQTYGFVSNQDGFEKFNSKTAAGDWTFAVGDNVAGDTGTVETVELTITCE